MNAESMLDRYVEALGGEKTIRSRRSTTYRSRFVFETQRPPVAKPVGQSEL